MDVDIFCDGQKLQQVESYIYLGHELHAKARCPSLLLQQRILCAKRAFYSVQCSAQLLGLSNCRVRVQLVSALAVSILAYGSVVYAGLARVGLSLESGRNIFGSAEVFIRDMLRWAVGADRDMRSSMLYVISNSTTLQLLCQKHCFRFFRSLARWPRFATQFVERVSRTIDIDLLGVSTLTWWGCVQEDYGQIQSTKPIYKKFRHLLLQSIKQSERVGQLGVTQLLCDIMAYQWEGEEVRAPPGACEHLLTIGAQGMALKFYSERDRPPRVMVQAWPSWLTVGHKRGTQFFTQFFYCASVCVPSMYSRTYCPHCSTALEEGTFWDHILMQCTQVYQTFSEPRERAFLSLCRDGYRGLAMYACFPLFQSMYNKLIASEGEQ